jgi:hypothetical protein
MSETNLYCVMRACSWQSVEVNGIPLTSPPNGPQRYIPVFDTQEQAIEWAEDGDRICLVNAPDSTTGLFENATPEADD